MASKKVIGVLMPERMGLDMETATNVIISSSLYPSKSTPDKESTVPCDAIIESPELAKHIYGANSTETRVRRFDCENDLVFICALESAEARAKLMQAKRDKIIANLALAAAAKSAAAGPDAKTDSKSAAPPAVAVGTSTSNADSKAAPASAAPAVVAAPAPATPTPTPAAPTAASTATTEPKSNEDSTAAAAAGGDKKKKKKKKLAAAAATGTAAATATGTAAPTSGAPSGAGGTAPVANLWGSMCLNTFKFVGNSDKWTELAGPVLMFAHPRVAKSRGGNHHYRVADAKKLLAQTFDDDAVKANQAKFAATTWEGKIAAQKERHEMRNRGGEAQKLQDALLSKTTGQTVSMAVPAPATTTTTAAPASK